MNREELIEHLREELAKRDARIFELEGIVDKAWNRSHQLEQGAYIPGALDAWKRPVLQNLPYDFSGNPGTPATQYCNGWNDAGGYWKAHADDLRAELAAIKAQEPAAEVYETTKSTGSGDDEFYYFDISARLQRALASGDHELPNGLSIEQMRERILAVASQAKR